MDPDLTENDVKQLMEVEDGGNDVRLEGRGAREDVVEKVM